MNDAPWFGIQGGNIISGSGRTSPAAISADIYRAAYRLVTVFCIGQITSGWRIRFRDAWRVLRGRAFAKPFATMTEDEYVEWMQWK